MKNALHSIQLDKIYRWAFMCVFCIDVYQLLGKQFTMTDIDLAPTDTEPTEAGTYIVEFYFQDVTLYRSTVSHRIEYRAGNHSPVWVVQ